MQQDTKIDAEQARLNCTNWNKHDKHERNYEYEWTYSTNWKVFRTDSVDNTCGRKTSKPETGY